MFEVSETYNREIPVAVQLLSWTRVSFFYFFFFSSFLNLKKYEISDFLQNKSNFRSFRYFSKTPMIVCTGCNVEIFYTRLVVSSTRVLLAKVWMILTLSIPILDK